MRISSIDIGSNAIRQLIVQVNSDGSWTTLMKERKAVRLGTDVFQHGVIKPDTEKKLLKALKQMKRMNRKFRVGTNIALATSAFRDAKNKKLILSAIYKKIGFRIYVISGDLESRIIRSAVQNTLYMDDRHHLLLDIGGGSIELTHLQNLHIHYSKSFKWGMVRTLAEASRLNISPPEVLRQKLKKTRITLTRKKMDVLVGTGGNLEAIAKLKLQILKKAPNTLLTLDELTEIYKIYKKSKPEQRASRFDLRKDRVDVLEPAIYLTMILMRKFHIPLLKIPGIGLKEGAILNQFL